MTSNSTDSVVSFILGRDHTAEVLCVDKFLGDEVIKKLADQLKINSQKTKIVLRGNCIGLTGAQALSTMLSENKSLQFMSLEWNQIASEGAACLAKALKANETLLHLDLRNNSIGDDGALALVEAIQHNDTIRTVDLRWNQITDRGALAFKAAMLERRPRLALQTQGNPISTSAATLLDQWLQGTIEEEEQVIVPDPVDTSFVNTIANSYQSAVIQKENASLRETCRKLQESCSDMRRQLDTSAIRVTELEQDSRRHEFRAERLEESYRETLNRLAALTADYDDQRKGWEAERKDISFEMKTIIKEREGEIRQLSDEKERVEGELRKTNEALGRVNEQLEVVMDQSQRDRESCQEEIRLALDKASEAAANEKKSQADISILNGKLQRSIERKEAAESELDKVRTQLETALKTEMYNHEKELETLREDFSRQVSAANDKISQQGREIAELHNKAAKLQTELTTQKITAEQELDRAVNTTREVEKDRSEQTISDLRQRLEVFLSTRSELEGRCKSFEREIKQIQEEHQSQTSRMKDHMATLDAEIARLRSQVVRLKESLAAAENESRLATNELNETQRNLMQEEEKLVDCRQQLQTATAERQQLRERVASLAMQLDNTLADRVREYNTIAQSVARAVEKEFESLRVNMHIKLDVAGESDNGDDDSRH